MALCPFAKHKLIAPGSNDPRITPRAAILHVDAGGARTLFSFFRYRSGGIESHFHVPWIGKIEQYRDTDWQADANYHANDFAISIESQGFAGGKWTRRQLRKIERLLVWLHETHPDIALRVIPEWDSSGVGYHVMFGSPGPWTPVSKSCPGPERIKQFFAVLQPWMASDPTRPRTEEFTMDKEAKAAFADQDEKLDRLLQFAKYDRLRALKANDLLRRVKDQVSDAATKAEIEALLADDSPRA